MDPTLCRLHLVLLTKQVERPGQIHQVGCCLHLLMGGAECHTVEGVYTGRPKERFAINLALESVSLTHCTFLETVLQGHSHTPLFTVAYGCFQAAKVASSSCDRDYSLKEVSDPLCETPPCAGGETKKVSYLKPYSLRNSLPPTPSLCRAPPAHPLVVTTFTSSRKSATFMAL